MADRRTYFRSRYVAKCHAEGRDPNVKLRYWENRMNAIFVCLECGAERTYGVDGGPEYNPLIQCRKRCKGWETPTRHAFVGVKAGDIWVRTLSTVSAPRAGESTTTPIS